MIKINWKVRAKNPYFWASLISSFVTILYIVLNNLHIYPAFSENDIIGAVSAVCSILSTIGVVTDPTTEGIADSERAMMYTEPKDSDNLTTLELDEKNKNESEPIG